MQEHHFRFQARLYASQGMCVENIELWESLGLLCFAQLFVLGRVGVFISDRSMGFSAASFELDDDKIHQDFMSGIGRFGGVWWPSLEVYSLKILTKGFYMSIYM